MNGQKDPCACGNVGPCLACDAERATEDRFQAALGELGVDCPEDWARVRGEFVGEKGNVRKVRTP